MLLILVVLGLGGCAAYVPRVAQMTDSEGIQAVRAEFEAENFDTAVISARAFLTAHPGSKHLDEAIYILARSSYEEGNFLDAEDYYRRLLRDFPQSDYTEDSAYYLALAILSQSRGPGLDQSETHAAHVQLRSFLNQYPDSKYAERARYHIGTIREKLAHKAYDNAMVYKKAGGRARYAARFYFEEKVYGAYPETEWAGKAIIQLCDLESDRLDWARVAEWAGRYLADFPDGPQRDRAREYLDQARAGLGREVGPEAPEEGESSAEAAEPEPDGGRR